MNSLLRFCGMLVLLWSSVSVQAADVKVEGAWARATVPGQKVGMAGLILVSPQAAALVGASSPACDTIELHSMIHEGGMMKMRQVPSIALPAGNPVELGPGGYHLMLIGLKAPLKAGDKVPLKLDIELAGKQKATIEVTAEIKPMGEMHRHGH